MLRQRDWRRASFDVSCSVECFGAVEWCHSMKTAMGKDTQLEFNALFDLERV